MNKNKKYFDNLMLSAKKSLDNIDKYKKLLSNNSPLYKKEHKNAAKCMHDGLLYMAHNGYINRRFINDITPILKFKNTDLLNYLKQFVKD